MNKNITNNNSNYCNNSYYYNHNNSYNNNSYINYYRNFLKSYLSHIYMCIYNFFNLICTYIYKKHIQTYICLLCAIATVSCKSSYIYRAEFKNGSVEYFETKPDTTVNKNIKSFIRIKIDNIGDYE